QSAGQSVWDVVIPGTGKTFGEAVLSAIEWWDSTFSEPFKRDIGQMLYEYSKGDSSTITKNPFASVLVGVMGVVIDAEDQFGDGSLRQYFIDAYENGYGGQPGDP